MARLVSLAFAMLLAGCIVPHYVQHNGALVPHAAPVQSTGQPMEQQVGFELGATNLADLAAPESGATGTTPPAGIAVAQHQARMAFAVTPKHGLRFAWFHERAFHGDSHDISPTIPPLDDRSALGYGMAIDGSIPTSTPGFRIGVATELEIWSCPYVSYTNEIYSGTMTVERSRDLVGTAALGITPSYHAGNWTGFGGVTMRNHPTMVEKQSSDFVAPDPDVTGGPLNVMAAAGVAFRQDNVEVALDVHQAVTTDPVRYGPALGLWLRVEGGKRL